MEELKNKIINWLKASVKEARGKGLVFGLSGGIDSAVVAILSKLAFPEDSLALIMPCSSKEIDKSHAEFLAEQFKIQTKIINLDSLFSSFLNAVGELSPNPKSLEVANLKPRFRMLSLYFFANKLNYLVVGTGNKSELTMGYFTKYGDGGVDLLPLGNLLKTEVKELAKFLGVPEELINKVPTAGLWEGQTDEGEMGITYKELDEIIRAMEDGDILRLDSVKLEKVKRAYEVSSHKRALPLIFRR